MTREQIETLKKLDRAPDGSCWYCATVMRGHFEGCPVALLPRLLAERERLLAALKNATLFHSVAQGREAEAALAFAEESAP
jgi:hypothetical protein